MEGRVKNRSNKLGDAASGDKEVYASLFKVPPPTSQQTVKEIAELRSDALITGLAIAAEELRAVIEGHLSAVIDSFPNGDISRFGEMSLAFHRLYRLSELAKKGE